MAIVFYTMLTFLNSTNGHYISFGREEGHYAKNKSSKSPILKKIFVNGRFVCSTPHDLCP
jgi:hypothetical protein